MVLKPFCILITFSTRSITDLQISKCRWTLDVWMLRLQFMLVEIFDNTKKTLAMTRIKGNSPLSVHLSWSTVKAFRLKSTTMLNCISQTRGVSLQPYYIAPVAIQVLWIHLLRDSNWRIKIWHFTQNLRPLYNIAIRMMSVSLCQFECLFFTNTV